MRILLLFLTLVVGYPTCRDNVVFNEIQPAGIPQAKSFPANFKGSYYRIHVDSAMIDTEFLVVDDRTMDVRNNFTFSVHKDCVAYLKELRIVKDSAYLQFDDTVLSTVIKSKGDTLILHYSMQKPVFSISDTAYLKVYKEYCFLNYDADSAGYYTDVLFFGRKDTLIHGTIESKTDSSSIEETMKYTKTGGGGLILKPTRDELLNFIKLGGFSKRDKFKRR